MAIVNSILNSGDNSASKPQYRSVTFNSSGTTSYDSASNKNCLSFSHNVQSLLSPYFKTWQEARDHFSGAKFICSSSSGEAVNFFITCGIGNILNASYQMIYMTFQEWIRKQDMVVDNPYGVTFFSSISCTDSYGQMTNQNLSYFCFYNWNLSVKANTKNSGYSFASGNYEITLYFN